MNEVYHNELDFNFSLKGLKFSQTLVFINTF